MALKCDEHFLVNISIISENYSLLALNNLVSKTLNNALKSI